MESGLLHWDFHFPWTAGFADLKDSENVYLFTPHTDTFPKIIKPPSSALARAQGPEVAGYGFAERYDGVICGGFGHPHIVPLQPVDASAAFVSLNCPGACHPGAQVPVHLDRPP